MQTAIRGHSGATVTIENGSVFKSVYSFDAFKRLEKCIRKQMEFQPFGNFEKPDINHIDAENLRVEMDYITHKDPVSFIVENSSFEFDWFKSALVDFVDHCMKTTTMTRIQSGSFQAKCDDMEEKIDAGPLSKYIKDSAKLTLDKIVSLTHAGMEMPIGYCHGDLTFGNMLISEHNRKIYLIDFLDPFISTPLADLAKLAQESTYAWSYHLWNRQKSYALQKQYQVETYNIVIHVMNQFLAAWPEYRMQLVIMILMNDMRLLQYEKSDGMADRILTNCESLISREFHDNTYRPMRWAQS